MQEQRLSFLPALTLFIILSVKLSAPSPWSPWRGAAVRDEGLTWMRQHPDGGSDNIPTCVVSGVCWESSASLPAQLPHPTDPHLGPDPHPGTPALCSHTCPMNI